MQRCLLPEVQPKATASILNAALCHFLLVTINSSTTITRSLRSRHRILPHGNSCYSSIRHFQTVSAISRISSSNECPTSKRLSLPMGIWVSVVATIPSPNCSTIPWECLTAPLQRTPNPVIAPLQWWPPYPKIGTRPTTQ